MRKYVKLPSRNKLKQTCCHASLINSTTIPPTFFYLTTLGCSKDSSCLSTATSRMVDSGIPSSSVCTRTLFRATKRPPFFKSRALYTFPYAPSPISATGSYCWVELSLSIFSHGEVLRGIPKLDERAYISQRHYWESGAGTCTACRARAQKEAEVNTSVIRVKSNLILSMH